MQKTINELVDAAYQTAVAKGWHEEPHSFGDIIALIHSELSEALEEHRNGCSPTYIYFEGEKPCGIPIELADVVIRVFTASAKYGINLENMIEMKMVYNSTRAHRHGGKKL